MFDWFKNISRPKYPTWDDVPPPSDMDRVGQDISKVVKFPELKAVPAPEPEPEATKPGRVFYRLGLTDNNRMSISMYYGEVTMNKAGVQSMIDQLTFYRDQLDEDDDE